LVWKTTGRETRAERRVRKTAAWGDPRRTEAMKTTQKPGLRETPGFFKTPS